MSDKVHPIKPSEITPKKGKFFPNAVLESFNELITKMWNGKSATIKQEDVVKLMVQKGLASSEIFNKGWLDVEDMYERAGWSVEYDKPSYKESYPATFTFKQKSKNG